MTQSSRERNRLHKRIGRAIQQRTAAIVTANEREVTRKPEPDTLAVKMARATGPKASRGGSSRERLKAGSYGVGFQGPRGFGTPTGKVGKREADGGKLAPITPKPLDGFALGGHKSDSQRFAGDVAWGRDVLGYDYRTSVPYETTLRRQGKKKRWKVLDLNDK